MPKLRTYICSTALLASVLAATGGSPVSATPTQTTGVSAHSIKIGGIFAKLPAGSAVALPILGGYELAFKEANAL